MYHLRELLERLLIPRAKRNQQRFRKRRFVVVGETGVCLLEDYFHVPVAPLRFDWNRKITPYYVILDKWLQ